MFLSWSGWGWLAIPAAIMSTGLFYAVFSGSISGRGDGPVLGSGVAVAAIGLWALGRRLNKGRRYPDVPHALFSFPMDWYAVPFLAAGVLFTIATLLAPR